MAWVQMIAIAHLLVVLVLIKVFRLDRTEAFAALLFGVFIDLDHVFGLVEFVSVQGLGGALDINAALASDIEWKSLLHSPIAALIIAPAAVGFRNAIPLVAWGLHLAMDWVQIEVLGVLSLPEMVLIAVLAASLLLMEKRDLDSATGRKNGYRAVVGRMVRQAEGELGGMGRAVRRTLALPGIFLCTLSFPGFLRRPPS